METRTYPISRGLVQIVLESGSAPAAKHLAADTRRDGFKSHSQASLTPAATESEGAFRKTRLFGRGNPLPAPDYIAFGDQARRLKRVPTTFLQPASTTPEAIHRPAARNAG